MAFTLLDQTAEDNLHAARLLTVETRPFQRVSKRLTGSSTPIQSFLTRSVPASNSRSTQKSGDEVVSEEEKEGERSSDGRRASAESEPLTIEQHQKFLKDLQRFREDVLLDFAGFDSSIARIQFLRSANEKERKRYAEEKVKIQETAQSVRDNTAQLKVRLEEARETLKIRKEYDVLAEKITRDSRLKSRDDQAVNIEKLRNEIEELEREGVELHQAWLSRREGLSRVADEAARLRRIVRGEPEPEAETDVDRDRIDEDESDGDADENMFDTENLRRDAGGSHVGTPRPGGTPAPYEEDAPTPLPTLHENGAGTPVSTNGDGEASAPRSEAAATADGGASNGAVEQIEDIEMEEGQPDGQSGLPQVRVEDMDTS